ncbi:XdhC family protein [Methyloligella sp. 2.7D]|uniref:XdhC family protein n=1 Tax=unclassified Methyloligella TaxID=2625955 RepID=UPI00157BCECB|nr:XdhC family protein [Methyloligella sp. GL2]QKP78210.1 XdhC family protein [Methyloligella sp. GL2]
MNAFSGLLRFLLDAAERGERTALVTITDVIGSSPRAVGSHMGVSETGAYVGSVSGGCIEAAVVTEARRVIESGRAEEIRFGAGSRFIDIRLPCGGGIDLAFTPHPPRALLAETLRLHQQRTSLVWALGRDGAMALRTGSDAGTGWLGGKFQVRHLPALRLCIFGRDAEALSLMRLAAGLDVEICLASPDEDLVALAAEMGGKGHHLQMPDSDIGFSIDRQTAVVMLFHDHDWELGLLPQILRQPALFVGAMGSRKTHANRLEALRLRGVAEDALNRVTGPIGLIPSARDPQSLALSVMAQLVDCYNKAVSCQAMPDRGAAQDPTDERRTLHNRSCRRAC